MALTRTMLLAEAQALAGDSSATTQTILDRGINQGLHKFRSALSREWTISRQTFSIVASQQYYQTPEDCIRVKELTITVANVAYPLKEIADERTWHIINMTTTSTSSYPQYFYVRGDDEVGIWPIPSASLSGGGELVYEGRQRDLIATDFTTGTVTLATNSANITHSAAGFTTAMVGLSFKSTSTDQDQIWYRVASYTSASVLVLENVYAGIGGAGKSFIIGDIPDIPDEFHLSLVDYALYRFSLLRRDTMVAHEYKSIFDEAIATAKSQYSSKITSQVISPSDSVPVDWWRLDKNVTGV